VPGVPGVPAKFKPAINTSARTMKRTNPKGIVKEMRMGVSGKYSAHLFVDFGQMISRRDLPCQQLTVQARVLLQHVT
jgi:hypothetical protein